MQFFSVTKEASEMLLDLAWKHLWRTWKNHNSELVSIMKILGEIYKT